MLPVHINARKGLHLVSPPGTRTRPLVLVADHHEDTRAMLHTMLTLEGFDVVEADGGDAVLTTSRSLLPDAIVLDGTLTEVDGLSVARRIQARDPDLAGRIVFVSGFAGVALEGSVYAAGCDSFLLKPVDFDRFLAAIRRVASRPHPDVH